MIMEKPVHELFTPNTIEFVSMKNDIIGSIYFQGGRIRLIHRKHPKVDIPDKGTIERYVVYDQEWKELKNSQKQKTKKEIFSEVKNKYIFDRIDSLDEVVVARDCKLIEVYKKDGKIKIHPSRGGPKKVPYQLNQRQINILYVAAKKGNNQFLWDEMNKDSVLKKMKRKLNKKLLKTNFL